MAKENDEKKIIIDDDWKTQAQKEKEQLVEEEKKQKQDTGRPLLPDADFAGLISMLATQAFFSMVLLKSKENEDIPVDLNIAKYNIDLIAVIDEKTKGNLSEQEQQLLTNTLHQLRMAYVQASNAKE